MGTVADPVAVPQAVASSSVSPAAPPSRRTLVRVRPRCHLPGLVPLRQAVPKWQCGSPLMTDVYGTASVDAVSLLESVCNSKPIQVRRSKAEI